MLRQTGVLALLVTLLVSGANAQIYRDGDRPRDGDRYRDGDRSRDRDRDGDRSRDRDRDGDRDRRSDSRSADWTPLGCRDVDLFSTDRDTIRVGQRDGRFRALRLHVRNVGVEILDLRVIYSDGEPDHVSVGRYLRAGEYSEPLDLRGRARSIDRIEMVYRSAIRPADIVLGERVQRARVCVHGLQRDRDR